MTASQDAKSLELDLTRKNNICTLLCGSVYRPVHDSVHTDEYTVYVCVTVVLKISLALLGMSVLLY